MATISLCMIVKDEEEILSRCLDSVNKIADEVIIIDTGSTDNTKAIASKYTKNIFDFEWIDDFSAARNEAFSKATMDYILWLDADDVIEEEDYEKFMDLKENIDLSIDSVTMNYNLAVDEYGNVAFSSRRNRLVKREKKFRWIGAVHEYLEVYGNISHSDIAITHKSISHDSDRNLNIYENRLKEGEVFSPRDLYYFANELLDHKMYERAARFYEDFLDTKKGWIEDNISSCGKLADCYYYLGDREKELNSIVRSFTYGNPRSEFCCRLGYKFLDKGDFLTAIIWYKLATQLETKKDDLGFYNPVFSTWLPHLQLCVCYDRIGNHKLAYLHNEVALKYRPNDEILLKNKEYFDSILKEEDKII